MTTTLEARDIFIQTNSGPERIPAEVLGPLAVHPARNRDGWSITHLRTGYELGFAKWNIPHQHALALMELLQPLDWDFLALPVPDTTREAASTIGREYLNEHLGENQ